MSEVRSHEEPIDETPENKGPKTLGVIDKFLPKGWSFDFMAPYASLTKPDGQKLPLVHGALYREEASRVGLPGFHARPVMGQVMRTADGKLYVCIGTATPNDPPNPNEFQWAPHYPNKYEATWAPIPEEIASQIQQ